MKLASTINAEIDLCKQFSRYGGIARLVTRVFHEQYRFVGDRGQSITLPTFEICATATIKNKHLVPHIVFTRSAEMTLNNVIAQEDGWLLRTVQALNEVADTGATNGLGTLTIEGTPAKTLFKQITTPMKERGVVPKSIFMHEIDYDEFVNLVNFNPNDTDGPEEGLTRTDFDDFLARHRATYKGANVYKAINVPQGTAYVFGSRTPEEIEAEPDRCDLLMTVRTPTELTITEEEGEGANGVEIKVFEEIAIGIGGIYAQVVKLPETTRFGVTR